MSRIAKSELQKKYGLSAPYIHVYIKRGHLVVDEDGMIDDQHPVNAKFISKRKGKTSTSPVEKPLTTSSGASDVLKDKFQLDAEKTAADIERIKSVTELNELKLAKLQGEVIPYEMVMPIFIMFTKALMTAVMNEDEARLLEIAHSTGLPKTEVAKFRKRSAEVVNSAVDEGVKEAKKQAKRLVAEYSETRGKGERA